EKLRKEAAVNLSESGIKVHIAKDSEEARKLLKEIIGDDKPIIKSKSNVANEIGVKNILKDVIETDIGDYIVELCESESGHPVLPAMTLTPEEIAAVIKKKLGQEVAAKPESIVNFVRKHLRQMITNAKVGISGANAITADGSIMILENEGNISLVSRIPEKHIVLAGIDKIVRTREDALIVAQAAAAYGTGQEFPVYISFITGPSKTADIQNKTITGAQGAKEVHLILVDNGRSQMLSTEFEDLLRCINCGACLNFCPIFHQITNRYGSKYAGARGVLFAAYSEDFQKAYDSGAYYCTMCRNCSDNCPAEIDLAAMMKKLREKLVEQGIEPKQAKEMIENVQKHGNPFGKLDGKKPEKMYCC
ncbi:MAG: LUD domain-containing protein, partial [Candidatus Woesearchaeota archaeon]